MQWCQVDATEKVNLCQSVFAAQDLVSSLWVADADKADALKAMQTLSALAAARIQTQVK